MESDIIDPRLRTDTPGNEYTPLHRTSTSVGATKSNRASLPTPQSGLSPKEPQSIGNAGSTGSNHIQGEGSPEAGSTDPKRPRACEACRGLKVRCEFDANNPDGPCKRCAKAIRNCVVTMPSRKRQKKTDSRVAELEKKIDALTASLQATKSQSISVGHGSEPEAAPDARGDTPRQNSYEQVTMGEFEQRSGSEWPLPDCHARPSEGEGKQIAPPVVIARQKRKHQESRDCSIGATTPLPASSASANRDCAPYTFRFDPSENAASSKGNAPYEYADLIDRGIVTMDVATQIFNRFISEMAPHLSVVVFPHGTTAADIRKSKPTLFLSILSASSGSTHPEIQRILTKEVMQIYATKIICHGEKSLELVQSLLISTLWYWPPDHFEELKFYQLIHLAAVMAIDLNICRNRSKTSRMTSISLWKDFAGRRNRFPDPEALECRRVWLVCYFLCCSASMGLRRPNLIRWTPYLAECIDVLETSPEAVPSDRVLCQWVRCQKIAEDVGTQFSMDDASAKVSISDTKVQFALKGFERDLQVWSEKVPEATQTTTLKMTEHVINLYMHEIALHVDHNVEEFRPGFSEENFANENTEHARIPLTSAHIAALSTCLTSIDGIFESFLSLDVETIRTLPILNFVRVAYAVVVLIKMYFAAAMPNSELGQVILKENMKVESYLERLLEKFRATAADDKSRPASKFLMVLVMLNTWFNRLKAGKLPPKSEYCNPMQHPQDDTPAPTPVPQSIIQQQQALKNEYSPSTPLQLLSEVATGGNPAQASRPQSGNQYLPSASGDWQPTRQHQNQQLAPIYSDASSVNQMQATFASNPGIYGNIDPTVGIGADFDFTASDGFEQAMGITLGEGDFQKYFSDDAWLVAVMMDPMASGNNMGNSFDGFG